MIDVGELVRGTRTRNGLDQRTLARRAGTTQAQVSRIERGETSPGIDTLARLFAAMGERLELDTAPGPRANQTTADLARDAQELTPGEGLAQAIELSRFLTGMTPREQHR
jgi:transcriptional regulator with XRE-family HTH domain